MGPAQDGGGCGEIQVAVGAVLRHPDRRRRRQLDHQRARGQDDLLTGGVHRSEHQAVAGHPRGTHRVAGHRPVQG